jgi:hypothetical protein
VEETSRQDQDRQTDRQTASPAEEQQQQQQRRRMCSGRGAVLCCAVLCGRQAAAHLVPLDLRLARQLLLGPQQAVQVARLLEVVLVLLLAALLPHALRQLLLLVLQLPGALDGLRAEALEVFGLLRVAVLLASQALLLAVQLQIEDKYKYVMSCQEITCMTVHNRHLDYTNRL